MKKCIVLVVSFVAMTMYAQAPDIQWTKTYGGAENDVASSIQQTSDGGYIVAGYTESFGAGGSDVWILRLDSLGDTLWTKTYGGDIPEEAASIQHTDSGYIVVGGTGFHPDIWLLKMDENGDTLWTRTIDPGGNNNRGHDVRQTSDGGYVIAGLLGEHYWSYITVTRTDSLGNPLWINNDETGMGNSVLEASDGNYIIAGSAFGGGAGSACVLIKVDPEGTMLWCKEYPPAYVGYDVLETNDSCLTACGTAGDICLIRTDANGDTLWTKLFCEGIAYSLDRTFDGGYIIAGETGETLGDAVCIKTDSLGDTLWTAVYGGPGHDIFYSVLQTSDGGYVMAGETSSFGAGNADVWIVKLGPDVGVEEDDDISVEYENCTTTIFRGPLQLPDGKDCKVFDITGRIVEPTNIAPGIYFLEVDNKIVQKVVKVR